jgi:hypothetical protein
VVTPVCAPGGFLLLPTCLFFFLWFGKPKIYFLEQKTKISFLFVKVQTSIDERTKINFPFSENSNEYSETYYIIDRYSKSQAN